MFESLCAIVPDVAAVSATAPLSACELVAVPLTILTLIFPLESLATMESFTNSVLAGLAVPPSTTS